MQRMNLPPVGSEGEKREGGRERVRRHGIGREGKRKGRSGPQCSETFTDRNTGHKCRNWQQRYDQFAMPHPNLRHFLKMSEFDFLVVSLFLGNEFMLYLGREGGEGRAAYVQRGQVLVEVLKGGEQR